MRSKRPKTRLPRVTLLAYSKRDLDRFCHSVEALTAAALDLERLNARLEEQVQRLTMRQRKRVERNANFLCVCGEHATNLTPGELEAMTEMHAQCEENLNRK